MPLFFRNAQLIVLLNLSILFSTTFPEIEQYSLDNGIKIILSPSYDVKYVNVSFLYNHGFADQATDEKMHETIERVSGVYLNPRTARKTFDILKDFDSMGTTGRIFSGNFGQTFSIVSEQILADDLGKMLTLTKEIFSESKEKKDKPVIVQRFMNFFLSGAKAWGADLGVSNSVIAKMHILSMIYDGPMIRYNPKNINGWDRYVKWKRSMFGPENLTIMISGNINIGYTKLLLEQTYGDVSPEKYTPAIMNRFEPTNYKGARFIEHSHYLTDRGDNKILIALGSPAPAYNAEDHYPYLLAYKFFFDDSSGLLATLLDEGVQDRDYFLESGGKVYDYSTRMPFMFFALTVDTVNADSTFFAISKPVQDLIDRGMTDDELSIAKEIIYNETITAYYNPHSFSHHVLKRFSNDYNVKSMEDELDRFDSVRIDDINRVLKKYFNLNDFSIVVMGDTDQEFKFLQNYTPIEYVDRYGSPLVTKESK